MPIKNKNKPYQASSAQADPRLLGIPLFPANKTRTQTKGAYLQLTSEGEIRVVAST
jgi:hypothetical protein